MQMIDVIKRLREIENKSEDVTRALENAEKLSVKQVDEGVQITVTGSDAVLSQILKLAGMIGAETQEEAVDTAVEAENRPYTNSPDEVVADVDAAVPAGSDLHGAKTTNPKVAGGDNPMQPMSLRAALGM